MKRIIIRVISISFALCLIFCVLFGQTIKARHTPAVQFAHARSGSLSHNHILYGRFVWDNVEDIHLPDAQSYPILITELPLKMGEPLGYKAIVLRGIVTSIYQRDYTSLEDKIRKCEYEIDLLSLEEKYSTGNTYIIEHKKKYQQSEKNLLNIRLNSLEALKTRLETVRSSAPGYFIQYYVVEGDLYSGTSAAYCFTPDQYPVLLFEAPESIIIHEKALAFSLPAGQQYRCTVIDQYTENGKHIIKAIPEKAFWSDHSIESIIDRSAYISYTANSEHYETLIPSAAIHAYENETYVYLAVKENSYWSENYVVKRKPITIIASGDAYTAVAENVMSSENIIVTDEPLSLIVGEPVQEIKYMQSE